MVGAAALLAGCRDGVDATRPAATVALTSTEAPPTTATPGASPSRRLAERLCASAGPEQVGTVTDPALVEVSGLVASARQPGVLWAIADSGSAAQLVALGLDGEVVATVAVDGPDEGWPGNVDWEDLALVPGGAGDQLVVADTGDNGEARDHVALVVVPEPDLAAGGASVAAERWELAWPDGPRDAEALAADPRTGELLLFSKQLLGGTEVVRVPASAGPDGRVTLEPVGALDTGPGGAVTGAAVAADGSAIVLRTYLSLLAFDRPVGAGLVGALAGEPCRPPAPVEPQGESVAWLGDGRVMTVSEGGDQPLWALTPAP